MSRRSDYVDDAAKRGNDGSDEDDDHVDHEDDDEDGDDEEEEDEEDEKDVAFIDNREHISDGDDGSDDAMDALAMDNDPDADAEQMNFYAAGATAPVPSQPSQTGLAQMFASILAGTQATPMDVDGEAQPVRVVGATPSASPSHRNGPAVVAHTPKWPDFRQQPDALGVSFNLHSFSVALSVALDSATADRPFQFGLTELQEFLDYLDLEQEMPNSGSDLMYLVDKLYPSQGPGACSASISHVTHHWRLRIGELMSFFEALRERFPNHLSWARDRIAKKLDQIDQTLNCVGTIAEQREIMRQVRHQSWSAETSPSAPLVWFDRKALAEFCTPFQKVILALYSKLRARSYRIQHGNVFAPKLNEGQYVHFFTKLMTVAEFVAQEMLNLDSNQHWLNSTHSNRTTKDAIEHFELYGHMTLPTLNVSRYLFAYNNGVFDVRTCKLTPHSEVTTDDVCANYFNLVVPDYILAVLDKPYFKHGVDPRKVENMNLFRQDDPNDWLKAIKTEYIDKIFDYQLCEETNLSAPKACRMNPIELDVTKRFIWYIFARLTHNVNDLDNDQRILSVTGQSGTGKSMLQDLCNAIYPPENIMSISPNNESGFVLSGLERPETFMWILPEVQKDCKLKPSDFYALICGDRVSIQIKYQHSRSEVVKAAGAMFGNSMNIFHHGAKRALARRVFLLVMRRVVLQKDLNDSIKKLSLQEVPYMIIKSALAYKSLRAYMEAQQPKMTNITMVWPKYFHENSEALVANADCMEGFLTSMHVKLDPGNPLYETSLSAFRARFRDFTRDDLQMKNPPVWDESLYQSAFNQHSISCDKTKVYGVKLLEFGSLEQQNEADSRQQQQQQQPASSAFQDPAGGGAASSSGGGASSSSSAFTLHRSAPPSRSFNDEPVMDDY